VTKSATYLPFLNGRYDVVPGLSRFGRDFGNGDADQQVFQLDDQYPRYRAAKLGARTERLSKYVVKHELSETVAGRIARFISSRLAIEHPQRFQLLDDQDASELKCQLTNERLRFDRAGRLIAADGQVVPQYAHAIDALASQVQEDLAIVSTDGDRHWVSAIHLCFPNHWAAEDKVGRDFISVHEPVAGIERINRDAQAIVRLMTQATQGQVRFAWGIATDNQLNHHPEPPPNAHRATNTARTFDPAHPQAFVRVERQTIWGFPDVGAALFTIRTYFLDCQILAANPPHREALIAAIKSMSAESLHYKGMVAMRDSLLTWLEFSDAAAT